MYMYTYVLKGFGIIGYGLEPPVVSTDDDEKRGRRRRKDDLLSMLCLYSGLCCLFVPPRPSSSALSLYLSVCMFVCVCVYVKSRQWNCYVRCKDPRYVSSAGIQNSNRMFAVVCLSVHINVDELSRLALGPPAATSFSSFFVQVPSNSFL